MIQMTLYKKEWKNNLFLWIIFAAVLTMYATMIISMFDPKLGESLEMMAESMPGIFAAFGMAEIGKTLIEFLTQYLYGFLLLVFPLVYIIILSNRLVAKYVDNGSMAYLLSTPESRRKIVNTQILFFLSGLISMLLYVAALIIITCKIMFPKELEVEEFVKLNVGLFGIWVLFGGICFLCSSIFNETKKSIGVGAGIAIYAVLAQMISQVGDKYEKLKYITPLTLFDSKDLIAEKSETWLLVGIAYGVGILCFIAASEIFRKKDLPI